MKSPKKGEWWVRERPQRERKRHNMNSADWWWQKLGDWWHLYKPYAGIKCISVTRIGHRRYVIHMPDHDETGAELTGPRKHADTKIYVNDHLHVVKKTAQAIARMT